MIIIITSTTFIVVSEKIFTTFKHYVDSMNEKKKLYIFYYSVKVGSDKNDAYIFYQVCHLTTFIMYGLDDCPF